jgi:uncharacterized HAD superfamily protein
VAAGGHIYVDFDDVLSHTIEPLVELLEERFGRRVPVDAVEHFDLGRAFGLATTELEEFMRLVHTPELLAGLEPREGAARTLAGWTARGCRISVMTGRPPGTAEASRAWLRRHRMPHERLACVDKYGRPAAEASDEPCLELSALADFDFALAVEDSAEMAVHLAEQHAVPVALIDRPWNRTLPSANAEAVQRIVRCESWAEVAARFPAP